MRSQPIWHPQESTSAPAVYFEAIFSVSSPVNEATLRCAGTCAFEVRLNGTLVCRGVGPALTPDPVWETATVTEVVRAGENRLQVTAHGGEGRGRPWFRAEGRLSLGDGATVELGTGPGWLVRRADAWQNLVAGSVRAVYLATATLPTSPGTALARGDWESVAVVEAEEPWAWDPRPPVEAETWARRVVTFGEVDAEGALRFVDYPEPMTSGKCVRREALLRTGRQDALVQTRDPARAVYLVLDFGRPVTGYPRLRLHAGAGGVVDLGFARRPGELEETFRYVAGPGPADWTGHRLVTTRYLVVRLGSFSVETEVDCISMIERRGLVLTRGAFAAPGALPQVWATGLETLEACRQEVYRLVPGAPAYPWFTALPYLLNECCLTGDTRTAAAMLDSSRPPVFAGDGSLESLGYPLFVEAFFRYSGDRERVAPLLSVMVATLEPTASEGTTTTVETALRLAGVQALARLCRVLRDRSGRERCEQLIAQAETALDRVWNPDLGLYGNDPRDPGQDGSQWPNALVLFFGLGDEARRLHLCERLRTPEVHPVGSLHQAFFLAGGLWRAGADRRGLQVLNEYWGRLVDREGTTWPEKVRPGTETAAPGPEYLLGVHLLGIHPLDPGGAGLEIRPCPSGLDRAGGQLMTGRGPVRVEWRLSEGGARFFLRTEVAGEGELRLALPRLEQRFPTVVLNGETVWRNEKVHPNGFVHEVIAESERVVLVLHRSGVFEAEVA
jgi:hypothetical protein